MTDTNWDELLPKNDKSAIILKTEEVVEQIASIFSKYNGLVFHVYTPMDIIESSIKSAFYFESLNPLNPLFKNSIRVWEEYDNLVSQLYRFIEDQSIPLSMVLSSDHIQVINECIREIEGIFPQYSITIKDSELLEMDMNKDKEIAYLVLNVNLITSLADN